MLMLGFRWSIVVSSLFWSFCLFDTLGDDEGASHAYWIVLVIFVFSIFLLFLSDFLILWNKTNKGKSRCGMCRESLSQTRKDERIEAIEKDEDVLDFPMDQNDICDTEILFNLYCRWKMLFIKVYRTMHKFRNYL
jgi:hypothetical protein